ncbi:complex I subunit 4 family protein [Ignatzschineria sp. LJL83]
METMQISWLSLVIWLPIIGGLIVLTVGNEPTRVRWMSLAFAILAFIISLPLLFLFNPDVSSMQFVEQIAWSSELGISYHLGIDGFSMPFIILTTFVTILVVIAGWEIIKDRPNQYFAAFLILEGLMNGIFASVDGILFYVFFEAMLIPMFLIIGIWGGPGRITAALKFFLYTFLGSIFLLVALIYLYFQSGDFNILGFQNLELAESTQKWLFFAFLAGFAVKVPMFPVHTWLPSAHVEAPTGGSVILAAITLKIGGYGFVRFILPIAPLGASAYAWLIVGLSVIAILYIALVALVQRDMKKMIAYSSISHMGFVTLAFILPVALLGGGSLDPEAMQMALQGGMMQMISHGLISSGMFLCIGVLYDRIHSREIADYGGVINSMPIFGAFFIFFAMANSGLPGTSGFIGEFWTVLASFHYSVYIAILVALSLILSAAYNLWLTKRVILGDIVHDHVRQMKDINGREWFLLGSLAILIILLGVWPDPIANLMQSTIDGLITHLTGQF